MWEKLARLVQNIYFKIVSCYVFALLTIFSIVIIANIREAEATDEKNQNSIYHTLLSYAQSVEADLNNITMIQNTLLADDDINDFLYLFMEQSTYEQYVTKTRIGSALTKYPILCPIIRDIQIYSLHRNQMISYSQKVQSISKQDIPSGEEPYVIRNGKLFAERKRKGVIISIELDQSYVADVFQKIRTISPSAEGCLCYGETIVFKTPGLSVSEPLAKIHAASGSQKSIIDWNGTSVFAYPFFGQKFTFFVQYKPDSNTEAAIQINSMVLLSTGIVVLLLIMVIAYISHIVKKPMNALISLMKEVERGNLEVPVTYDKTGQFGYLFAGFQKMLSSLKSYIVINYQQQIEINRSEIKQLQSQINPHFLYNCFFNISKLCKVEDSQTAMILSQKLAAYYMYITRNKEDTVTLDSEYLHTRTYLDIQQIRFQNRVQVDMVELPQEYSQVRVPKIILQPIIENAYKYVFETIDADGKIRIVPSVEGTLLTISISDNGNHLTDEQIEALNAAIQNGQDMESTGIVNVHRRLLLRNPKDGLRFQRGLLGGLEVILQIHIKLEELQNVPDADCGR